MSSSPVRTRSSSRRREEQEEIDRGIQSEQGTMLRRRRPPPPPPPPPPLPRPRPPRDSSVGSRRSSASDDADSRLAEEQESPLPTSGTATERTEGASGIRAVQEEGGDGETGTSRRIPPPPIAESSRSGEAGSSRSDFVDVSHVASEQTESWILLVKCPVEPHGYTLAKIHIHPGMAPSVLGSCLLQVSVAHCYKHSDSFFVSGTCLFIKLTLFGVTYAHAA